jgi:hypothetical protein
MIGNKMAIESAIIIAEIKACHAKLLVLIINTWLKTLASNRLWISRFGL